MLFQNNPCFLHDFKAISDSCILLYQVIHMVSAAKGAEEYYTTTSHVVRSENLDLARQLDDFASQVYVMAIIIAI